jgi:hypothetical protein
MRQAEQWASGGRVGFLGPGERETKKMAMVLMSCVCERGRRWWHQGPGRGRGSWSGKKTVNTAPLPNKIKQWAKHNIGFPYLSAHCLLTFSMTVYKKNRRSMSTISISFY